MSRIPELDGLRACAILAVFFVHYYPAGYPLASIAELGWCGVDLFFAISGFLITGILLSLRDQPSPYKIFYWRRALRIFPPYYLALSLIQILAVLHGEKQTRNEQIGAWFLLSSLGHGFSPALMWSRLTLHNSFHVLAQPLLYRDLNHFSYGKGVFWSLSVEELFYLIWAPVVLKGSRRVITWFCIAPMLFCPLIRALNHTRYSMEAFSFPSRFDSLAAGACVALAFAAVRSGRLSQRVVDYGLRLTIVITVILAALFIWGCGAFRGIEIRSTTSFAIFGYSVLAALCAAIVGACARWSGAAGTRFLRLRPFLQLGTISYMSYLIQIPVYVGTGLLLQEFGVGSAMPVVRAIIAAVATIGLAALSWKYFESPILALKDRCFGSPRLAYAESEIEHGAVPSEAA